MNSINTLTVSFVIGANATGKSFFIKTHFPSSDAVFLNIFDYQQRVYKEAGYERSIPFHEQFNCLYRANEMLLADIIEALRQGRNVVAEQTLFKAKRRISYIDEIRKAADTDIEFFVMCPSEALWNSRIKERDLHRSPDSYKDMAAQIEFPNPAEGIDRIYEVVDDEIRTRMDPPKPEILSLAHQELVQEAERMRSKVDQKNRRADLLESMNERPFWHYCECCGKKELLTAREACKAGWDYPPDIGHFGLLGPRTCGNCQLTDTLYWKVLQQELPLVVKKNLSTEELKTWERIRGEPESLLEAE